MARRRKLPEPEPTIPAPVHSLDPTDWRMYCDLLQDADAPESEWDRARRIAESLAQDARMVLVSYCPPSPLDGHWLRVGTTWFIGAEKTHIEKNRLVWWRAEWVREGFARYPYNSEIYPHRDEEHLLKMNTGTPQNMPHPRWHLLLKRKRATAKATAAFFEGHSHHELPEEYL